MASVVSAVSHGPMDAEDVGGGDDGRDEEPAGSPLPHRHRDWECPCLPTSNRVCVRVCVCVCVCVCVWNSGACNMQMQHAARSVQHATKRSAQATGEVQRAPRGSAIALRFGS
jgi:hypothetical protein